MTGLLAAETIKLSKRWVFRVLILVLLALTGLTGAVFLVLADVAPEAFDGIPELARRDALILGIQTVLGQTWFPLILAVVMVGSEFRSNAWSSALTRESRRSRHIGAKIGVMTLGTWLATIVVIAAWIAFAAVTTEGASGFSATDWIGVGWKSGLVQLTWLSLGLGAVSWVRSTGLAIGIVIAFSFGEGLLALWKPFRSVSLSNATNALFGELSVDVSGGFGVGFFEQMSFPRGIVVVLVWSALATALAYTGLRYRDA